MCRDQDGDVAVEVKRETGMEGTGRKARGEWEGEERGAGEGSGQELVGSRVPT